MTTKDQFTLEIILNALHSIADEMFEIIRKTAKSPIIYDVLDFSTGLTDGNGNIVAQATGVPLFLGIFDMMAKNILKSLEGEIEEGDVIITNDPYISGTHLNDVGIMMPIFHKGEIVAIALNKGHWNDIGGMYFGSWGPASQEIYQEGIIIPPTKIYSKGRLNKDLYELIMKNSRIPDFVSGDLFAQIAAVRYAEKRIKELIEKYGISAFKDALTKSMEDGRKLAYSRLSKLPKGNYEAHDYLDDSGTHSEPAKISVKVRITDKEFIADFSENPPSFKAPVNTTLPALIAAVRIVYIAVLEPHASICQGFFEPLKVIYKPGTVFTAEKPYPVSTYWETLTYAADLVWKALAPHIPEKLPAGHFLSVVAEIIAGKDPRTGELFALVEPNPGGWGAAINRDGVNALVSFADGETYASSVEVLEQRYPLIVERYTLNTEDGVGHGRFRGGFGIIKDYRIYAKSAIFTTAINRAKIPPWGVNGGMNGTRNCMVLITRDKTLRVRKIAAYVLSEGDVVSIRTGGGGGWGDPLERDPELVLSDVINEYIAIDEAREIYGVVIDKQTLKIDIEKTKELREKFRKNKHEYLRKIMEYASRRECNDLPIYEWFPR